MVQKLYMTKTIFIDIDGTILKHHGEGGLNQIYSQPATLLPGVIEKFEQWKYDECRIILTTARPESMRDITEHQLKGYRLFWDDMIMGLPRGPRVVINDTKDNGEITAFGVPVVRNAGLKDIDA